MPKKLPAQSRFLDTPHCTLIPSIPIPDKTGVLNTSALSEDMVSS